MPITSTHPDYDACSEKWKRIRHCLLGSDAVKHEGQRYLPALVEQAPGQYKAYLNRALFLPVLRRTAEVLSGMALFGEPRTDLKGLAQYEGTLGEKGRSLRTSLTKAVREVAAVGRRFYVAEVVVEAADIIDAQTLEQHGRQLEQDAASNRNVRPQIVSYDADKVINWHEDVVMGERHLRFVVVEEEADTPAEDGFGVKRETVYREFRVGIPPIKHVLEAAGMSKEEIEKVLDNPEQVSEWMVLLYGLTLEQILLGGGVYYQAEWRKVDDQRKRGRHSEHNGYAVATVDVPLRLGGVPWRTIPGVIINSTHLGVDIGEVPMDDLAHVNLSHYRNSADLEHGRHFTALPTPYALGFEANAGLKLGAETAWASTNSEGKVGMLEFSGKGLAALQEALTAKEQLMAKMGALFLEDNTRAEKVEAIKMRRESYRASLASVLDQVDAGFSKLLGYALDFVSSGTDRSEVTLRLSRQFTDENADPQLLTTLMTGVQDGTVSWETFAGELHRTGLLGAGRTLDDERQAILDGPPSPLGGAQAPSEGAPDDDAPDEDEDEADE